MLDQLLKNIVDLATGFGVKLVISLIIIIVGFELIKFVLRFVENGKIFEKMDPSFKSFALSFLSIALKIVLLITVASYLGIPMTSMITVLGSAAVAIGLALQGSLANIASGIMIVVFKTVKMGDFVENAGFSGTVIQIGLFSTVLNTPDNVHIIIPNSQLTSQTIKNYSAEETRRVDIDFSVAYDSDIDKVKTILLKVAGVTEGVMKDPAPVVYMTNHGESAIKFQLRVWCSGANYWDVKFGLMENVKLTFDAANVEIPYPQLDVHVKNQ